MKVQQLSALDYAKYRVEMTRRDLHELLAKVELGTEIGSELACILTDTINRVEELAEYAEEYKEEA